VDARTGDPVAGAVVFTNISLSSRFEISGGSTGWRDTTTDETGEFSFPSALSERWINRVVFSVGDPGLAVLHRDYGITFVPGADPDPKRWTSLVIAIAPDEEQLKRMSEPSDSNDQAICAGVPRLRCCEVAFNNARICDEWR
jgi:hypothetical protein